MKGFLGGKVQPKKAGGEGKAAANPDRVDGAPRADISLPKTQRRYSSDIYHSSSLFCQFI